MAIHVAVATGVVRDVLGWRAPPFNLAINRIISNLADEAVWRFPDERALENETVYSVLERFHERFLHQLRSIAGADILSTIREEAGNVARHNYHMPQFTVPEPWIGNLLAIHAVRPHGQDDQRGIFLPDLALTVRLYGCFIEDDPAAAHGGFGPGVKKLLRFWRSFLPWLRECERRVRRDLPEKERDSAVVSPSVDELSPEWQTFFSGGLDAIECRLCDKLFDVLQRAERCRDELRRLVESDRRSPKFGHGLIQRMSGRGEGSDIILTIHPIVEGFRETRALRGTHPELPAVGTHRLLSASAVRQALGHPTLSGLFPTSLWEGLDQPVRHFLLQAGEQVARQSCPVAYPNLPSSEDMDRLRGASIEVENGKGFQRDEHAIPLRRLGWYDLIPENIPRGTFPHSQVVEPLARGGAPWDWTGPIDEMSSALYSDNIEQSLHLQDLLDLYPLHKRVLGLVEYIIVPLLKSRGFTGAASSLWAKAFTGASRLCRALLPPRADWWATLEALGNWLLIASGHGGSGTAVLDLATLLDRILSEISSVAEVHGVSLTFSPVSPSVHAKQLTDLADWRNEKAACMTFYLGKVALQLRNAIEHGSDRVVAAGLRVDCPGIWAGAPGMSLSQLQQEARKRPQWRLESQLRHLSSIPPAANALLLTPASLQRCLVLISLVLHGARSHLQL
jgi:hypothetical protein